MRASSPDAWIADEPRLATAVRRVLARAMHRRLLCLGVSVVLTALVLANRLRKLPAYDATIYFSLVESEITERGQAPPPPHGIQDFVTSVALSNHNLLAIMDRHGLGRARRAVDPVGAAGSLRDDIEIFVERNYFVYERSHDDPPRSASVIFSYTYGDAATALAVVHELGQTILDKQAGDRSAHFGAAIGVAEAELEHAQREVSAIQAEIDRAVPAGTRPGAQLRSSALIGVQYRLRSALDRVATLDHRIYELRLGSSAEDVGLGLGLRLVDEEVRAVHPPIGKVQLAILAVGSFAGILLVTCTVVGGWGRRVYSATDLEGRGFKVLGSLASFPGVDVGSYRSRSKKSRRNAGRMTP